MPTGEWGGGTGRKAKERALKPITPGASPHQGLLGDDAECISKLARLKEEEAGSFIHQLTTCLCAPAASRGIFFPASPASSLLRGLAAFPPEASRMAGRRRVAGC